MIINRSISYALLDLQPAPSCTGKLVTFGVGWIPSHTGYKRNYDLRRSKAFNSGKYLKFLGQLVLAVYLMLGGDSSLQAISEGL